jgi:peptide deformylase
MNELNSLSLCRTPPARSSGLGVLTQSYMIGDYPSSDMTETLQIIFWPDPRLRKISQPVREFNQELRDLAARMFELMRENKGVGLAAPQVGRNIRMFVMNATGLPEDDRVYINPVLSDADGEEEDEEGCLSLPDIRIDVLRNRAMRITAFDLDGKPFEQVEAGFPARVWQHEFDHLNGVMLTDRMGPVAKMSNRRKLKELEEQYEKEHPAETKPPAKRKARK